ncbi:MAG: RsmB/NOP family class I SAM-dependent RNA methyltransferase [Opitutaceae bacterium]|nr:RsmB/NOP family class I SAM-dependent RNA methyltransferase [Opitutaceae bacterium]
MAGEASSIAANQTRTFLELWASLAPFLATDRNIPERLNQLLGRNRSFGSRDRRLYRELAYTGFRFHAWLAAGLSTANEDALRALVWLAAENTATQRLKAHWCNAWPKLPARVEEKRSILSAGTAGLKLDLPLVPDWFSHECPEANNPRLIDTLHSRSPLWIRVQTDKPAALREEFRARGWQVTESPVLSQAWRIEASDQDLTDSRAFREGQFEIQDLGSQILAAAPPVREGTHWFDACAGAGGKTLPLAQRVGINGRVTAWDVRGSALAELRVRADRSPFTNIRIARPVSEETFDGVFVDAPCSGSGTWRRAPHLKLSTHESTIRDASRNQLQLLSRLSAHVRPEGVLVYATCSLCRSENHRVTTAFLDQNPDFRRFPLQTSFGYSDAADSGELTLTPEVHDTDGFYLACLIRQTAPKSSG